jgi:hypothetical protein
MITPKKVGEALRHYLETVSDEQFREDMRRSNPHLFEEASDKIVEVNAEPISKLSLKAYVASALTVLTDEQRLFVYQVSDVVVNVCQQFGIEPYEPRKQTDPIIHPDASPEDVFRIDRQRIAESDLLITLCDYPSFGGGQELDFAYNAFIPIILVSKADTNISRMVKGIPSVKLHIEFRDFQDLERSLTKSLTEFRPVLEGRKRTFAVYKQLDPESSVGANIRRRRTELGLSQADVVRKSELITLYTLQQLEDYSDHVANPSLVQLQHLADILDTTIADLLNPN